MSDLRDYEVAILSVVKDSPGINGRDLYRLSGVRRWWRGRPWFYQKMSHLQDRGLVTGETHDIVVNGYGCRERRYTLKGPS